MFLTLFVATHVSILASDTSSIPHETPSQAYGTLRYHSRYQESGVRTKAGLRPTRIETTQHPADLRKVGHPYLASLLVDITEIDAVTQPQLRLVTAAHRGHQIPTTILRRRMALLGEAFGQIGADRFRRPPQLIGQGELLDPRQLQTEPMQLQRQPIGAPEDLQILTLLTVALITSFFLEPDPWLLIPGIRSFGARLEPRYIFGAGRLI